MCWLGEGRGNRLLMCGRKISIAGQWNLISNGNEKTVDKMLSFPLKFTLNQLLINGKLRCTKKTKKKTRTKLGKRIIEILTGKNGNCW